MLVVVVKLLVIELLLFCKWSVAVNAADATAPWPPAVLPRTEPIVTAFVCRRCGLRALGGVVMRDCLVAPTVAATPPLFTGLVVAVMETADVEEEDAVSQLVVGSPFGIRASGGFTVILGMISSRLLITLGASMRSSFCWGGGNGMLIIGGVDGGAGAANRPASM